MLNGAVSAELEVTESGNYAVEVFAVLEKDGTTLTSLGAKSDPVKCTVTPHEYEENGVRTERFTGTNVRSVKIKLMWQSIHSENGK